MSAARARTYERVTFRPERADGSKGRARSVYLENPHETSLGHGIAPAAGVLVGREVGKDSDSILHTGDRTRIIGLGLIIKREPYEMDLRYGELVPAGTASHPIVGKP